MNGKITARIIEPQKFAVFGFGETIEFRAKATKETKDGVVDISRLIQWRKPVKGMGPTFSMSFKNRKNAIVAIYLNGVRQDSIELKIVCKACDLKPPLSVDEKLLARISMAEGAACSPEERRAICYVVVNRFRFFPARFGATLTDVVHSREFAGNRNDLFRLLGSDRDVAEKIDFEQCRRYRETLIIAREVLVDRDSAHEPLFVEEGKHACYMNRSTNTPPNGPKSPLIRSKTVSGWAHSFYAHVSNAPKN